MMSRFKRSCPQDWLPAAPLAASSAILDAHVVQNKRRRKCVSPTPNSYLNELNHRVSDSPFDYGFALPALDCNGAVELESMAAPGSNDAYLDQLNAQQQESWGCKRPTEDSACGEAVKRVACGQQIYLKGLELQGQLGSGAYGCVFKCTWRKRDLAIKIYHDVGRASHDAEREIMLLKQLGGFHRSDFVCHLHAWRKKRRRTQQVMNQHPVLVYQHPGFGGSKPGFGASTPRVWLVLDGLPCGCLKLSKGCKQGKY